MRVGARGLAGPDVTIRDLVRHALRHRAPITSSWARCAARRPRDLLQALNTGHGGSLATVHANNAAAALSRLATCAMQASDALPWAVVCRGVVDGIEAVIRQARTPEGVRRVEQYGRRPGLRRAREPLDRRRGLAGARRVDRPAGQAAAPLPGPGRPPRPPAALTEKGGHGMSEREDGREPIRVDTREAFERALDELLRTGRPIEAPSLDALAAWDVDLEDDEGGIEGR